MKIFSPEKFIDYLSILITPVAISALVLAWSPANFFADSNPTGNGYVAPRNLGNLIANSQKSTVIVECEQLKGSFGSGWAVDKKYVKLKTLDSQKNFVVTAHHVVKNCIRTKTLNIYTLSRSEPIIGKLQVWNKEKDLALISISQKLKTLDISKWEPLEGYWVMAIGAPEAYEASVTLGYIMNYTNEELLFTAPISEGSSGGPLLDNEGHVIGTVTASAIGADFNIATSFKNMCDGFLVCK